MRELFKFLVQTNFEYSLLTAISIIHGLERMKHVGFSFFEPCGLVLQYHEQKSVPNNTNYFINCYEANKTPLLTQMN